MLSALLIYENSVLFFDDNTINYNDIVCNTQIMPLLFSLSKINGNFDIELFDLCFILKKKIKRFMYDISSYPLYIRRQAWDHPFRINKIFFSKMILLSLWYAYGHVRIRR